MSCFLIDPETKTVTDVGDRLDPGKPLLECVRDLIGAHQLLPLGVFNNFAVLFIDNFGLLKRDPKLWGLAGEATRIAGKGLLFAIDHDTGYVAPLVPERIEDVRNAVVFAPEGVTLLRIEELLVVEPGAVPMINRVPVYSDSDETNAALAGVPAEARTTMPLSDPMTLEIEPPPPMPGDPATEAPQDIIDNGWVIRARRDGTVTATRFHLKDGVLTPHEMRSAKTIAELREQMPPGVSKVVQPSDDEPEDVLEFWVG